MAKKRKQWKDLSKTEQAGVLENANIKVGENYMLISGIGYYWTGTLIKVDHLHYYLYGASWVVDCADMDAFINDGAAAARVYPLSTERVHRVAILGCDVMDYPYDV